MKKPVIGYIFCEKKLKKDEKAFLKIAKKKNIELVMFNIENDYDEDEIEDKIKKCDIIYNNSAEEEAIELEKTIEEFGKKVIDSPKKYFSIDDKWIFFLKCKRHKIPTPKTILLSENIILAKKDLIRFNSWPVILKRIEGTCGDYVEKANNLEEAEKIIKNFWEKGSQRLPIIAQEYIPSLCYRVTTIGDEIVQGAIKGGIKWKKTAVYSKRQKRLKIDKELEKIIRKVIKISGLNVAGIDLLKKDNKWIVLETNSVPGLDFFQTEREMLVEKIFDLLLKKIKR